MTLDEFEDWLFSLELQTLTEQLKHDIWVEVQELEL